MHNKLSETVGRLLTMHDIEGASSYLERLLRDEDRGRFSALVELRFSNSPTSVREHINSLIALCQQEFAVKAVYLAHNGLVFNYDHWYFDSLAYDQVQDLADDYEWLCNPRSRSCDTFTLTGLETVQEDFGWYVENELFDQVSWEARADIAENLVKVRVVQLIQAALASGPLILPIPIFATAYGSDFYCRFNP